MKNLFPVPTGFPSLKQVYKSNEEYHDLRCLLSIQLKNYLLLVSKLSISLVSVKALMTPENIMPDYPKEAKEYFMASMWFGAVIAYANCFSQTKGRKLQLDRKAVFKNSIDLGYHEQIINQRNSYVAHAGENYDEDVLITYSKGKGVVSFTKYRAVPPQASLEIMRGLVYLTADFVDVRVNRIRNEIRKECEIKFS